MSDPGANANQSHRARRHRNLLRLSCAVKNFAFCVLASFALTAIGRAADTDTMDIHRNIVYATPDGVPVALDLYVPKNAAKAPPVVIWIHGGGWEAGNRGDGCPLPLAKAGFAYASIDYRLSQVAKFPAQILDCKAAVRWVRANAAKYHYNADKIGVVGASAGGHLVALLGTTNDDPQLEGSEGTTGVSSSVQAVVDYFGPTDFPSIVKQATAEQDANLDNPVTHLFGGTVADKADLARLASPISHVSPKACPFFILHGDHDNIVPLSQSTELNDALKTSGVSSQLVIVKGGGHGFDDPASVAAAMEFLKQQLGAP
jgi:acetyl esterase/lipase